MTGMRKETGTTGCEAKVTDFGRYRHKAYEHGDGNIGETILS